MRKPFSYGKAIERFPFKGIFNNMGISLYEIGRYEEALGAFEKAHALDPAGCNDVVWHHPVVYSCKTGTVLRKLPKAAGRRFQSRTRSCGHLGDQGHCPGQDQNMPMPVLSLDQAILENPLVADAWLYKGVLPV